MKKRVLLLLTPLVLTTLACNLLSGLGGDPGSEESPSLDPVSDAPAAPQAPEAGPETIDLSDPALYASENFPAYTRVIELQYSGVDSSGSPKAATLFIDMQKQTQPEEMSYIAFTDSASGESMETVIIGEQMVNYVPGFGCSVFPTSSMQEGQDDITAGFELDGELTGQANLVESGVEIEGIVTDRYEITEDNLTDDSDFSNLSDASLYVAREGDYIVRVEVNGTEKTEVGGFDPNADTQVNMKYTHIAVENGSLNIVPPPECSDQLEVEGEYPVMEGASDLISVQDSVFYTINASLDEVLDFYRTKMVQEGWTLTKDAGGGSVSLASLEFTKDGDTVEVNAIQNGDQVAVTVMKK